MFAARPSVRGMPQHGCMTTTWAGLIDEVSGHLTLAGSNQFVLIQYDTGITAGPEPYAQAARDGEVWHGEVVSGRYLLPGRWPMDEVWLKRAGWTISGAGKANWFQTAPSPDVAAGMLVDGLRFGRYCGEPERFDVTVRSFVGRPGPAGGDGTGLEIPVRADGAMVAA